MEQIILDTVKECLEITDTSKDVKLLWSIKKTLSIIKNMIGCEDIFIQDDLGVDIVRTDKVRICELYTSCDPVHRLCLPITEIITIGWEIRTDVVTKWNFVGIARPWCSCECGCVDIVWKWWFATLPDDLMALVIDQAEMSLCNDKTIKKYQYLDKTVEYCCDLDYKTKETQLKSLYDKYYKYFTYVHCRCQ